MSHARRRGYNVDAMALSQITWHDVQQMPDDGHRREAIGGELHVTAAPSSRHQEISATLAASLYEILVRQGHGRLFHAPGVEFPGTGEGVQPDLAFVSQTRSEVVEADWIRGAPDLVIEILSPSTEERDRGLKLKLYRRQGVPEYWIVDPETEVVEVWDLHGEEPRCRQFTDWLPVRLRGDVVGEVELAEVFVPGA